MTGPIKVAPSKQKKGGKKEEVVAIPMTNSNAKKIWRSVDIYGWFKKSIIWSPNLRKFEELLIYMGDLKNL